MDLERDKEATVPSSGPFHSNQLYHSHLLSFKIITMTIQTDTGEGPNIKGRKGTLSLDHKTQKTSPIHVPTKKT